MQSYEFYFYQQNILVKNYHFTNKKSGIIGLPPTIPPPKFLGKLSKKLRM